MSTPTTAGPAPARLSDQVSVQLYTLREQLGEDPPGTLRRLAGLGLTSVEPFGLTSFADRLAPVLTELGVSAPTAHQHLLGVDLDEVAAAARALGVRTVVEPMVAAERWGSADDVRAVAAELNEAARRLADHGLAVGYHNHAHEMVSVDGTPALEVFADALDDGVGLEVDTYWVVVGGGDPVALLQRLGERVVALHLKDGPGTADVKDQVALGHGRLPVRAIVDAAPRALRVVELDDSRGDRFTAVQDSVRFLTEQGLA